MSTEQRYPHELKEHDGIIVQAYRYTVLSRDRALGEQSSTVVRTTDGNGLLTTFTFRNDELVPVVVPAPDRTTRRRMAERRQHR
jgi:ribosomal protein L19